jgi:hypothetical protein
MPRTGHNLTRRRAASRRLPVLECGRADPWYYESANGVRQFPLELTDGYVAAAHHLLDLGLTPAPNLEGLRQMWRRGSCHRRDAARIAQAWELVQ